MKALPLFNFRLGFGGVVNHRCANPSCGGFPSQCSNDIPTKRELKQMEKADRTVMIVDDYTIPDNLLATSKIYTFHWTM